MSRYAAAHANPAGPGDARPTALQIVKDEGLEGVLKDKVALVTGVSSGIGVETAKALAATGMRVFGAVRNLSKASKALQGHLHPEGTIELIHLDMNSLESVRKCAAEFLAKSDNKLSLLVCNAAVMSTPEGRTADGFELQFGTNHLAHFLLFQLVKPSLLASATPSYPSRVVNVSSGGHRFSDLHLDNLKLEGIYDPMVAYGQSKTANIYFANEIERRYASQNLHATSLMPGGIWSGLQQYLPRDLVEQWKQTPTLATRAKSAEQGAATTLWAAVGNEWAHKGGKYLENCDVAPPVKEGAQMTDPGYAPHVYDEEKEKRLWKVSCELVGVEDDE
ncbi:NAD(P)-binding protein [Periconia macrospinosa]|uniref:NAD(P)-binding protein n=1 Tax=Periconia macrospinosa TaxID=97972 RepID=A0A2V1D1L0_9PLEO|nr:NAD(P)-binding protein [Periconia macrospinosa]